MRNYKWRGGIFSRHGGSKFTGCWFNEYTHNVLIEVYVLPNNIPFSYTYTLAYVCLDDVKFDAIHDNFLQIIGGHTHDKC